MNIALSCDHTGYDQSKQLAVYIESLGHKCINFSPTNFNPSDDYPKLIAPAAEAVSKGECEMGIVLGGSGQGEAMTANRYRQVRCAVFYGPVVPRHTIDADGNKSHDPYEIIKLSRSHNDANMLSVATRFVGLEEMKHVIKLWFETPFSKEPRHSRRVKELDSL